MTKHPSRQCSRRQSPKSKRGLEYSRRPTNNLSTKIDHKKSLRHGDCFYRYRDSPSLVSRSIAIQVAGPLEVRSAIEPCRQPLQRRTLCWRTNAAAGSSTQRVITLPHRDLCRAHSSGGVYALAYARLVSNRARKDVAARPSGRSAPRTRRAWRCVAGPRAPPPKPTSACISRGVTSACAPARASRPTLARPAEWVTSDCTPGRVSPSGPPRVGYLHRAQRRWITGRPKPGRSCRSAGLCAAQLERPDE